MVIFRNKNVFQNIFRLFCSWEQNSQNGIQVFRNENSSQTNAYLHYSNYSYSGLLPNERALNIRSREEEGAGRGGMFICSKLRQNLSEIQDRTFERIQKVIWDHLLAFKGEIIQKQALFSLPFRTPNIKIHALF